MPLIVQRHDKALDVAEKLAPEKILRYTVTVSHRLYAMFEGKALMRPSLLSVLRANVSHLRHIAVEEQLNKELSSPLLWKRESSNQL